MKAGARNAARSGNATNRSVVIRKARRSDLKTVVSLWQQLMERHASFAPANKALAPHLASRPGAAREFSAWARKHIGSRSGIVLLAEVEERPVGYCLIFIRRIPYFSRLKRVGHIGDLLVVKEFRGWGISSLLKEEALQWFRRKGIKHVALNVLEKNRVPQSIYKKWGFFPFVVEMRKNL
jgi:GNAT superfamily N-acetyltransferase